MRALTQSSKHERSGHSRSLSFPSVCVWHRNELTTSHRRDPPARLGWWEVTFRLTNVIPERIIFVSRGITVVVQIDRCWTLSMNPVKLNSRSCNLCGVLRYNTLNLLSVVWILYTPSSLSGKHCTCTGGPPYPRVTRSKTYRETADKTERYV